MTAVWSDAVESGRWEMDGSREREEITKVLILYQVVQGVSKGTNREIGTY